MRSGISGQQKMVNTTLWSVCVTYQVIPTYQIFMDLDSKNKHAYCSQNSDFNIPQSLLSSSTNTRRKITDVWNDMRASQRQNVFSDAPSSKKQNHLSVDSSQLLFLSVSSSLECQQSRIRGAFWRFTTAHKTKSR